MLRRLYEALLDVLFPPVCAVCGVTLSDTSAYPVLCTECTARIRVHETFSCADCGARLPDAKKICHKDEPYILAAATDYDSSVIQELIRLFKYERRTSIAPFLGGLLHTYLKNAGFNAGEYVVIPVPLHSSRERERGFNQAELLAKEIGDRLKIEIETEALIRVRAVPAQAKQKTWEARRKNMQGAFITSKDIAGKDILLVDDVTTSGSTLLEASQVLKSAGARRIIGLVVAKAG